MNSSSVPHGLAPHPPAHCDRPAVGGDGRQHRGQLLLPLLGAPASPRQRPADASSGRTVRSPAENGQRPRSRLWGYAWRMPGSPTHDAFHEETTDPLVADARNFYKVEKWTRDGTKVDSLLYAGNSLGRARSVFEQAIKHRPRIHVTIRQQTRVLDQYPPRP